MFSGSCLRQSKTACPPAQHQLHEGPTVAFFSALLTEALYRAVFRLDQDGEQAWQGRLLA